ncbi:MULTISPECIES: gephyrin-like molybdotransferase Glp [Micrococcaceae]|uniref:molybdopterin molybdotransferase MoeA n=1 Tax=Micrococcaceae TaxID=1268 RepID=UPI00160CDD04|nr:gephyrin-like molybdotransferase Glp [Citricoccus sp.]MBB5748641.1 molybdopterin molybdotransferase [Micrococcus sp. TA1]HRO30151.1 molybdopterin molybdotransferase MoeA [Citricoccus sp.]HRO95075.1 molybdopterin molybdotransferase MoeA [Citricoccus sp.]
MAEFHYIPVADHQARVLRVVPLLAEDTVGLEDAAGHTLARDAVAALDLPPWDNSAMDGYAVRSADTTSATTDAPVRLDVVAELPAGTDLDPPLAPGQAARIMTGAPLPTDADAVVPLEDTVGWDPAAPTAGTTRPDHVELSAPVAAGRHVRPRGDDVRTGHRVASAGQELAPHRLSAVAAAGIAAVTVRRRPRVVVVSTGSELVAPGEPVRRGQIPDSNSHLLTALVRASGGEVVHRGQVSDDPARLRDLLVSTAADSDAVIVTGGASVGAHDVARLVLAPDAVGGVPLERRPAVPGSPGDVSPTPRGTGGGPETPTGPLNHVDDRAVRFDRVAVQPGKPQGFGLLPDGRPVWSLPGNPVSAWVSYLVFVEPGLLAMQDRAAPLADWHPVTTDEGWRSPPRREQFVPVRVVSAPGEPVRVAQATERGSGSHLAGRMARATGLVRVPAATTEVSAGDTVLYRALEA